jgi:two-component system response regulator AtoC
MEISLDVWKLNGKFAYMNSFKIFIVEDDPWYGELLKYHLSLNPDSEVILFNNAKDCLNSLKEKPNVVCIDFSLPDMNGDELLKKVLKYDKDIPVIVISGQEEVSVAVTLLKEGAKDYIVKDEHTKDMLWRSILNIGENQSLRKEVAELKIELNDKYTFEKTIIGNSNAIKRTFKLVNKAIRTTINVSVTGETGTGKELVAKAIHYNSNRKKKALVAVNMAAIPPELLESELFGHEKGAFTGAIERKMGKFEEANGGTLFLDEIGELDLKMQSKLLRVLQEREIVRVGGNKEIKFDARLITATHKDLKEEVQKGNFREDLYFRIFGLPIELPPLRERDQDILILANHFMASFCKGNAMEILRLSKEAKEKLMKYSFPGNVRELKAAIDLACVMSEGDSIEVEDLTFHSLNSANQNLTAVEKTLKEYNRDIIAHFLKKYNNNVVQVAQKLDIGKSTIYNILKSGEIKK